MVIAIAAAAVAGAILVVALSTALLSSAVYSGPGEVVAVPTFEPVPDFAPCPQAVIEGNLTADDGWGVILEGTAWGDIPAIWPHGFFAVQEGDTLTLRNVDLEAVARAGDKITAGGGVITVDGVEMARVCSHIEVLPPG
ncbi:MAG TPA: hypothetical protein VJ820_08675 [Propionibacteriaceae bacterium]|nr:hypothetical protein [Propionibacteriaceae bacterium]